MASPEAKRKINSCQVLFYIGGGEGQGEGGNLIDCKSGSAKKEITSALNM